MRPELYVPGELTPEVLHDVLGLAGSHVPKNLIEPWTPLERALACDWAMREHLVASDHDRRIRRPRPSFVTAAERHEPDPKSGQGVMLAFLRARGVRGATAPAIMEHLQTAGFSVVRETVQRWLAIVRERGLVTPGDFGRYKAAT